MTGVPDDRGEGPTAAAGETARAGRAAARARLETALADVLAGSGHLVLISGEPGAGKTHLAEWLARRARASGAHVAWGRCWEGVGAPELWPWLQVIRACLRAVDDQALRQLVGPHGGELTTLLAPLRAAGGGALPASESPAARFRLFNAIAHFLDAYAQRAPLAVVLDDLHRADPPSLLLLQFFTQEQRQRPILLLGTYRAPGAPPNRALTEAILEASREPGTERIALAGLDADETAALLAEQRGVTPDAALVEAARAWTGGNPLFLVECLRHLPAAPPTAGLPLPAELRVIVEQRLALLDEGARELLRRAAASDAALAGEAPAGGEALDQLLQAGLLQPDAGGALGFTHGLVRALLRGSPAAPPAVAPPAPTAGRSLFRREGEYWTIEFGGRTCRVRDAKGLAYLVLLLRHPGRPLHVTELISQAGAGGEVDDAVASRVEGAVPVRLGLGDAGVVLDAQAKSAYRRHLAELQAELREAESFHDAGRAERARREIDFVAGELRAAVGLGGRDRRSGSDVERARVNVTRSISRVVERIAELHPELADHLARCVRTGTFCTYTPVGAVTWEW